MMEKNSAADSEPLVQGHGTKPRIHRKSGVLLLVIVLISTLCTLCCIVFQLKTFILYLDLKQQSQQNNMLIKQYLESGDFQQTSFLFIKPNGTDASVIPHVEGIQDQTNNISITEKTSGISESFEKQSNVNRVRRSDEADDPRSRNNRRNNNNRRSDGARQEDSYTVRVIHLELHKGQNRELSVDQGKKCITTFEREFYSPSVLKYDFKIEDVSRAFITSWRPSPAYTPHPFAKYEEGGLHIYQQGFYLIYSQITFEDRYGRWSYSIMVNERSFIKCLSTEWGIEKHPEGGPVTTYGQCHTSAVIHLNTGDSVRIRSMYRVDNIHTDIDLSFWGFVKLS